MILTFLTSDFLLIFIVFANSGVKNGMRFLLFTYLASTRMSSYLLLLFFHFKIEKKSNRESSVTHRVLMDQVCEFLNIGCEVD